MYLRDETAVMIGRGLVVSMETDDVMFFVDSAISSSSITIASGDSA